MTQPLCCPFCGDQRVDERGGPRLRWIACDNCGCTGPTTTGDAAAEWNDRRFAGSVTPSVLAALKTAERFMAGFEGDPLQDGIGDQLAEIRSAISQHEGA